MTEIILEAYHVLDEIKTSDTYIELLKLNSYITNNLNEEYLKYQNLKTKLDKIISMGAKFHPDFKEISTKLLIAKEALYSIKEVKKYLSLKGDVVKELNDFSRSLGSVISNNLNVPNELGIVKTKKGVCK